jgi:hypothetical protein
MEQGSTLPVLLRFEKLAGKALADVQTLVDLIGATKTTTGLKVFF